MNHRTILKIALPLLLIGAGAFGMKRLIASKPSAKRAAPKPTAQAVDVITVRSGAHAVTVRAQGTVQADRVVQVTPQVSGTVVRMGPDVEPGSRLKDGSLIARLDDRDLRIVLAQRRADLVQARFALEQEQGRAELAEHDWQQAGDAKQGASPLGKALALRRPHLEAARARIEAAQTAIDKAQLDIARATVVAPFDAVVRERRVAAGQLVGPQTPLAVLVATDRFHVVAALPFGQLATIAIPGVAGVAEDAGAKVQIRGADGSVRRGQVLKLLSDLDAAGRMARVVIAVDDPLDPPADAPQALPLLLGAFVEVEIEARVVEGVIELPRLALREGDRAWVVGADSRMDVRELEISVRDTESVLVRRGLRDGDRVITSRISALERGSLVSVRGDGGRLRADKASALPGGATPTEAAAAGAPGAAAPAAPRRGRP